MSFISKLDSHLNISLYIHRHAKISLILKSEILLVPSIWDKEYSAYSTTAYLIWQEIKKKMRVHFLDSLELVGLDI